MLSIPLYLFLFVYLAIFALFLIFLFVNLYHLISTGELTTPSFLMTAFVFGATILVVIITWTALIRAGISWQSPLEIFDSNWITPPEEVIF